MLSAAVDEPSCPLSQGLPSLKYRHKGASAKPALTPSTHLWHWLMPSVDIYVVLDCPEKNLHYICKKIRPHVFWRGVVIFWKKKITGDRLFSILAILGGLNVDIASESRGIILTCRLAHLFLSPTFKLVLKISFPVHIELI